MGLDTAVGVSLAQGRAQGVYLAGLFVPLGPRPGPKILLVTGLELGLLLHWAQGRAQGVYLIQVLKLPLGSFGSTGRTGGSKGSKLPLGTFRSTASPGPGPRSLSVTGLETAVGLFVQLGPRPGPRSLSVNCGS